MSDVTIHEVLRDASVRFVQRGWTQGKFLSADCKECILKCVSSVLDRKGLNGAGRVFSWACLQVLDQTLWTHCADYQHCLRAAQRKADGYDSDSVIVERAIFLWNDRPGRTIDEVIRILELAADQAEAGWWVYHENLLATNTPARSRSGIQPYEMVVALNRA